MTECPGGDNCDPALCPHAAGCYAMGESHPFMPRVPAAPKKEQPDEDEAETGDAAK